MDWFGTVLALSIIAALIWPEELGAWAAKVYKGFKNESKSKGA